jgi:hypothetical protein
MTCEELRERITADPARADPEFDRHAAACPPCRAYQGRLHKAEALIRKALCLDLSSAARRAARPAAARRLRWPAVGAGLAAGVLSAATLWFSLAGAPELAPEELALAVARHWYQEPESWLAAGGRASRAAVEEALNGSASIDLGRVEGISFAKACRIAGERVPHLVVQGRRGPIMVVLLPGRGLLGPVALELGDEGLAGQIVPAGTGSIAVLGADAGETERVQELMRAAVEWTI